MSPLVVVVLLSPIMFTIHTNCVYANSRALREIPPGVPAKKADRSKIENEKQAVLNVKTNNSGVKPDVKAPVNITSSTSEPVKKDEINQHEKNVKHTNFNGPIEMESGALLRALFVLVALAVLFLIYIGAKTYYGRSKQRVIRKYGVRTRRSDIEMTPLPLDEDDEDETLFQVNNTNR